MANPNSNTSYWSESGILNRIFNEANGSINTEVTALNAGISSIAATTTSTVLRPALSKRKQFILTNESTANLFVAFGVTASATTYTIKLAPGAVYESPSANYSGVINGIWDVANGFARITELT